MAQPKGAGEDGAGATGPGYFSRTRIPVSLHLKARCGSAMR